MKRQVDPDFLAGGGEMGARMRALDWSRTPLGPPADWPQSLKTIVRVMLDSRYAMWMLWGPELTFFCNDAYLPTVGIKREWVLGARSDKVWEEVWSDIEPRLKQVFAGQATWDEGLQLFLERSGYSEETYHTFSYSPVYDDENRIAGMLCVVTEVTDRVIGERRLRVLRDLAANDGGASRVAETCRHCCDVLTQYPSDVPFAALYLLDSDTRRLRRAAWTRALPEALLPETIAADDPQLPAAMHAALEGETVQEIASLPALGFGVRAAPWPDLVNQAVVHPLKISALPGTAGLLVTGISPRRALDDAYRSFIGLVAKQAAAAISEARAHEAERRRAEELAELDRAKTAFFSNVSHEFRTPLTLMLGPLEDATTDPRVPPDIHDRLTLAQRNAARLQKLVNTLLDFSRIEAGRVQASYVATDLAALTRDLASTFRSAMEKAGLAFSVECDTLGAPVFVDREMWEKIVLNLLSNAFKFTLDGSVSVRLRRDGEDAVLEVADTGVGVPAHEIPRLFERFHRVEGTQGRTHEGSGIGLALVQELVKLHGASIGASSELGAGTTFRVRIPFGAGHLPAERVKATRAQASTAIEARAFVQEAMRWLETNDGSEIASTVSALNGESAHVRDRRFSTTFGARIVLADDNADMRAYVSELLAPYYRVEPVADGERALAAAKRALPDLIISDVMMPRLDGFGLLRAIRADKALQRVPVVFLSARAGEEARIEGLDAGADDYLVKPFSARELLARIGALLELRKMRAAAEEASRLRTAQYETLLNEAPLGVYLIDADFRIQEVNPTARAVFGNYPNLIGSDFADVIHTVWPGELAHEIVRLFRRTLATGEHYVVPEYVITRAETGMAEYYEWQINRIPLPDGSCGVVCYFRDISQHVLAHARLQAADRQKDEFLAMLAHELRNPLAPIRNAGEVLSRTSSDDTRAQAAIGIVHRQVGTLTRLVDDLLDVSRITQGRIELRRQPLQVADAISQAVEMVEPLMREKRHRLSVTSYQAMWVNGDPARLIQCVANVLTNAAKYTDPGGEIRLESRSDGGEAVLTVTDNGVGISKELLLRVFDLFVQSDRTLDRAQGGLGIGLSVVKRLVEMHGGRVAASSPGPGAGATFEIRLPLMERNEVSAAAAKHDDIPARKILIVDDNIDAADSLMMILRLDGHEVEAVYTAQDALERAAAIRPDVALLDIGLPKMNGYELAQHLRSQPDLRDIRLIALTGYGQGEDRERTRAAGFDDHLVKPADLAVLQKALALPSERR